MSGAKLGLIGGGNIGGTVACLMATRGISEVVILDHNGDLAKGKALDIVQSLSVVGGDCKIFGTQDYYDLRQCDVVIVTAGIARKPGMGRDDLLISNKKIIDEVAKEAAQHCPNAFFIVLTNPLDAMVLAFQRAGNFPAHKVVGMSGLLDTARFRTFLAEELSVSVQDVHTILLGGHGDTMVPMVRYTSVAGIPLQEFLTMGWLSHQRLEHVIERTRKGGIEIVELMKKSSAYYAPATAAIEMAICYLQNRRRLFSCASYLDGQYGVHGLYIGVPTIISNNGVEKIIELSLNPEEKAMFENSVAAVSSLAERINLLPPLPQGSAA